MGRRKDHTRDELKAMILDVAWEILGREGVAAVTARHIGTAIGYAPGTLYNIFPSIDDMIMHLNARTLDVLYDVLNDKKCHAPAKTPAQNMKAMARAYMRFAVDFRPYWLALFHQELTAERYQTQWYQDKVIRLFEPLERILKPLFTPAQATRCKLSARILWSAVHGLCFLHETGKLPLVGARPDPIKMADTLIDTYVAGLGRAHP